MSVDDVPGDHVAARVRRRNSLSIKSLLLLMLLLVSVGSNVVVGVIGYINGTESLTTAANERLIEVRDSRAREIVSLFDSIENSLLLASRDSAVVDAGVAFTSGFAELDSEGIAAGAVAAAGLEGSSGILTPEQEAELEAYFTDDFGPALNAGRDEQADVSSFLPSSAAARYLLYQYTVKGGDDASAIDDAGDGSAWSAAHAEYHDYLRRLASLSDYPGLVLISNSGQIVYSVNKDVDLGADLVDGPYSYTGLALAFPEGHWRATGSTR